MFGAASLGALLPGAGGSRKGYGYPGQAIASLGVLARVVGHEESGRGAVAGGVRSRGLRNGLADLIAQPQAYCWRFLGVTAAKRRARDRCKAGQAILMGQAMRAATVMMEAAATATRPRRAIHRTAW